MRAQLNELRLTSPHLFQKSKRTFLFWQKEKSRESFLNLCLPPWENKSGRICNSIEGHCCCYENLSRKLETKREAEVPRESQTPVL